MGTGLGGGTDHWVNAIIEYKGNIIVGGDFTSAGGVPVNNIAMWNGSSWSALGKGMKGNVSSLAIYNGNLYAGGYFDTAGGVHANNIAMWNGTDWDSLGGSFDSNSSVYSLGVYNNKLYVGGSFTKAGNIAAKNIARWNDTIWDSVPGFSVLGSPQGPFSFAVYNNKLYMACIGLAMWNDTTCVNMVNNTGGYPLGTVFTYQGYLIEAGSLIASSGGQLGNGINTFFPCYGAGEPPFMINTVAGYNGVLYAGGQFKKVSCKPAYDSNAASYIEQFSGPLSINELKVYNSIIVSPNPSSGIFTFQFSSINNKEQIEVYTMLGEKIYYEPVIRNPQFVIDLTNQPTGVYLYRITGANGDCIVEGKMIKE
ncbi:MAG TPA: T9SS type A sorting domain-containing protein [Bacteroidia bacterium]|nr:T9SS type A sorting domain-containing protein [Bacteroidia bacterium]